MFAFAYSFLFLQHEIAISNIPFPEQFCLDPYHAGINVRRCNRNTILLSCESLGCQDDFTVCNGTRHFLQCFYHIFFIRFLIISFLIIIFRTESKIIVNLPFFREHLRSTRDFEKHEHTEPQFCFLRATVTIYSSHNGNPCIAH